MIAALIPKLLASGAVGFAALLALVGLKFARTWGIVRTQEDFEDGVILIVIVAGVCLYAVGVWS